MSSFSRAFFKIITCLALAFSNPVSSMTFVNWVNRYNATAVNGGMAFTGNTVGLSKINNQNNPGTADSIGAYITTNLMQAGVGSYPVSFAPPATTTLSYTLNSSSAYLDLPMGSTILYAELIWGGSYGFEGENPYYMLGNIPAFLPDITSVALTSPQNINYSVAPNLTTTNFEAVTPGFGGIPAGNYIRTQDVTTIIANSGGGRYIVGGIPTTVAAADNTHNAATWTLAVVYSNPNMITSNLSLFIGAQQASNSLDPARA